MVSILTCALVFVTANASDAKAKLEQTKEKMRTLIADKGSVENKQREMRKLTSDLLDFEDVAKQTLGENFGKLNPKEKKEFAQTLHQLVEASYLSKINEANTSDIVFTDAADGGATATVKATANAQGSEVHLEFLLEPRTPQGWLVKDVVIDDVSLVRNYRSQFQKQLAKGSIADLQKKIQRKVAELKGASTADLSPKHGRL